MQILSEQDLFQIVGNSQTLLEKILAAENNAEINRCESNNKNWNFQLEQWCQVVAQGNWEQFENRLAADGLNLSKLRRAFAHKPIICKEDLPTWAITLNEVIKYITLFSRETLESKSIEKYPFINADKPIPFEEIFIPFIYVAKQKLIDCTGSSYNLLSGKSHATLENNLLKRLSELCSRCLQSEFSVFCSLKQSQSFYFTEHPQHNVIKGAYKEFIKKMLADGLCSFFREYSVIARLAATLTELWVDASREFILRLASDWDEIQTKFQTDKELGQVVSVKPGISDYHDGGRSVIALTFGSGIKLVYKPRNLGIEKEFFNFISWINQQNELLDLKEIKIINKSSHAWVEFINSALCQNKDQIGKYYQRVGMLLCIIRTLKGTDFHYENIIASGEYPVLFDLETLFQNKIEEEQNVKADATYIAIQQIINSVLYTHLLPRWECGIKGQSFDISGLGGVADQETYFKSLRFKNINTDQMTTYFDYGKTQPQNNLPSLQQNVEFLLSSYVEQIVDGFQQMYNFLIRHREILLAINSPLQKIAYQQTRFIYRTTGKYWHILNKSLYPKFVRNGIDRSIQLDILSRDLLLFHSKSNNWSLLRAEVKALEQLDIPIFTSCPNSNNLTISANHKIENFFTIPSLCFVVDCLKQLNDEDLKKQVNFIKTSVNLRIASTIKTPNLSDNIALSLDSITPYLFTQQEIVQQAINIATNLKKQAICSEDGSATWITLRQITEANKFQLQPMGYSLYDGCCGVALFLAALEKITGGCGFRNLTFAALQTLRKHLQNFPSNQEIAKEIGIGGAVGLGSIIYSLVRISQFLDEMTLIEDATDIASLITPDNIAADKNLDLIAGSAGTILGLLALHKITAEQKILQKAINCGYHLLNKRVASNSGYRVWETLNNKLLTGFAHGVAGISYALLKLYETTQDPIFFEAANEAIEYERSIFSSEMQNWPDLRWSNSQIKPDFMNSWCHGAPGIGLGRLGSLSVLDNNEIRQEIQMALKTTNKGHVRRLDSLCCGNFGIVDILLVASQKLAIPDLLETSKNWALRSIARNKKPENTFFSPNFIISGVDIPGFFQGTSGIGYELLRLAYPNLLPSVLLWE